MVNDLTISLRPNNEDDSSLCAQVIHVHKHLLKPSGDLAFSQWRSMTRQYPWCLIMKMILVHARKSSSIHPAACVKVYLRSQHLEMEADWLDFQVTYDTDNVRYGIDLVKCNRGISRAIVSARCCLQLCIPRTWCCLQQIRLVAPHLLYS